MANAFYSKFESTVVEYIGNDKAELALNRQLDRCGVTADTFTSDHLSDVLDTMVGLCTLYLSGEDEKLAELTEKLKSMI